MMQIYLQGGFAEKGRTSALVQHDENFLMLDAGIKVGGVCIGISSGLGGICF